MVSDLLIGAGVNNRGLMFVLRRSVPLCYVYPALLHYKAVARTRSQKWKDIAMIVFGMVAAAYTTIQTIKVRSATNLLSFPSLFI